MSEPVASAAPAGRPDDLLARRYTKTEAGRAEIRSRALPLARPARNLLLIIDASRQGADWLGVVQGCDPAALLALLEAGLVADLGSAGSAGVAGTAAMVVPVPAVAAAGTVALPAPALPAAANAPPRMSLAQALAHRSPTALRARIMAEARPRLGLIKGYRMASEAERCTGAAETRALAQRFVDQVRELDGDVAGIALAQVLIAPE